MSSRAAIKANFETGDTPTAANFADLIDSLAHASEDGLATTAALTAHATDTANPHAVTKSQVGLANVDNTADADKPISSAAQAALDAKAAAVHTHAIADVTGLQTAIDGKAAAVHTHAIADVTGLQTALDGKASAVLHADVVDFAARQVANGNYVDAQTLAALDRFVRRGVAIGWYSAIVEMYPFVGNNLAAALEKFKYHASAGATLTNSGFVEADYDQLTGLGTYNTADTVKHVLTGVVPSSVGMTNDNLGLFACPGDLPCTWGLGLDVYVDPEKQAFGYEANGTIIMSNAIGLVLGSNNGTLRVLGGSAYVGGIRGWCDGIQLTDTYPSASAALTAGGEVKLFRFKLWNSQSYNQGKAGCVVMLNASLTAAQGADLCKAIRQLQIDIGRRAWQPMDRLAAIGDSNSQGGNMHPTAIATNLGRQLINVAANSVALSISGTVGLTPLANFRTDFADMDASLFLIMLGTNDINNNDVPVATYQSALDMTVAELVRRGKRVLVCSIPHNLYSDPTKVANYQAAAKTVANIYSQPFCNMRNPIADKAVPGDYFSDTHTHFVQAGYDEFARFITYRARGIVLREQILDFGSLAAGASVESAAITMDQVAVGDRVHVDAPAALESGLIVSGYVTAADTVKVRLTNCTAGAIDAASGVFTIYVDVRK